MAEELVVREPFSLPGSTHLYATGEHIADAEVMAKVRMHHANHVRRIVVPDAPATDSMAEG